MEALLYIAIFALVISVGTYLYKTTVAEKGISYFVEYMEGYSKKGLTNALNGDSNQSELLRNISSAANCARVLRALKPKSKSLIAYHATLEANNMKMSN